MSVEKFLNVAKIFGGSSLTEEEKSELYKETMIMALARMTRADLTIDAVEVDTVIDFVKKTTGSELSPATIKSAASSELFESQPLDKHLKKVGKHLDSAHRISIVKGMAEVIGSDGMVSENEIDFFNSLVSALNLTPAELVFSDINK